MATSNLRIRFSDTRALMPGTFTTFSMTNLRNFNLNTPETGRLLLSQLKSSYSFPTINAPSSSLGRCYSVRKVVPTYTGPVFRVRRSSDNVLQDFFTDNTQSYLTTGANNTGTTYVSWIGANTAYVTIWYDQSTNANNATNSTNNTTQPNISLQNGKYVIQFINTNSTVLNITTPYSPFTVFCNFYNTNSEFGTIITTAGDFGLRFGGGSATARFINGGFTNGDWFFRATGIKIAYNNGVPATEILFNGWNALTLSIGVASATPFNRIGMDGFSNTRAINGHMSEMILHNKALVANDMIAYYYSSLINYSFPSLNASHLSMLVCYSTRVLNPFYKGPILRLRRSSDNTLQDFYTDNTQSYLTTGINNTGISYVTWIGANTAYVHTWYDQSSNANHAINTAIDTVQPNISLQKGIYVVQFRNVYGTVLNITTPIPTSTLNTIFAVFYNTNTNNGTIFSTNSFWVSQRFGTNAASANGFSNADDWYFSSTGTKLSYNNNISTTTIRLNDWNILTLSVGTPKVAGSWNLLGRDNYSTGRSINGFMAEFICHNKAILLNDIRLYNRNSIFNNRFNTTIFPTTDIPISEFMACYSVRLLISTYTGPVFRLRRSGDGVLQDFYTDSAQSYLTTGANNTGTTYTSWIGANTPAIAIWYDQSPNARNATSTSAEKTPFLIVQNGKYVIRHITSSLTDLTMTTGIIPRTIFSHFNNANANHGTITGAISEDFQLRFNNPGATLINGASASNDWYFSMSGTKLAYNNGVASSTIVHNNWNVLTLTGTTLSKPTTNFQMIGKDSFDNTKGMNGYMTEIVYINKTVTANDMLQYYDKRLF
jgi:hypothetical protein